MRSATEPAVEPVGAVPADRVERGGELGLQQPAAGRGRTPAREEGGGRGGEGREPRAVAADGLAPIVVDLEAVAGQSDGGHDDRVERQLAVGPVRLDQARRRSGHARREMSRHAQLGGLAVGVEVHVARRAARRGLPVVERAHLAVGGADHHEPAAPDVARLGVHHREREAHRDRRIHRVAAGAEHVAPDRAGERMTRHHHRRRRLGDPRLARQLPVPRDSRGRLGRLRGAAGAADQQG